MVSYWSASQICFLHIYWQKKLKPNLHLIYIPDLLALPQNENSITGTWTSALWTDINNGLVLRCYSPAKPLAGGKEGARATTEYSICSQRLKRLGQKFCLSLDATNPNCFIPPSCRACPISSEEEEEEEDVTNKLLSEVSVTHTANDRPSGQLSLLGLFINDFHQII